MKKTKKNGQVQLNPFRKGMYIGAGLMFCIFYISIIVTLETTIVDKYTDNKLTINSPLTNVDINQISKAKACSIKYGCIQDVALFIGGINPNSAKLFVDFMTKNPKIKTVCLGSGGGEINSAQKISSYVIKHDITTCMADYYQLSDYNNEIIRSGNCSSSCNPIMLSAQKRLKIGTLTYFNGHGYAAGSLREGSLLSTQWELKTTSLIGNTLFIDTINKAKTKDEDKIKHLIYAKSVANIPHFDDMKTLTNDELINYRIFTHTCKIECTLITPLKT
jgi:hypothetical protein